ncbi:class IV adenylate cyclase [Halomicrococcus gelatinilyticus]|uniref:class IV adenylate cyclase n=1 Tax=Halomicrococcus gelatinilyticus TaxID=1702103 RepID=UPI002E13C555
MYEVEVKVRADHDAVRERLDGLDARHVATVVQEDTYFDAPHREFADTDEALRLREEHRETGDGESDTVTEQVVTYKGPLVEAESKTRREVETAVADADAAHGVFEALGFDPAATVRKEREYYELDGYTVTLDTVDGLGEFVEVEIEAAEEGVEEAREGAYAVLRDLGLDPADQIRTSYLGLCLDDAGK